MRYMWVPAAFAIMAAVPVQAENSDETSKQKMDAILEKMTNEATEQYLEQRQRHAEEARKRQESLSHAPEYELEGYNRAAADDAGTVSGNMTTEDWDLLDDPIRLQYYNKGSNRYQRELAARQEKIELIWQLVGWILAIAALVIAYRYLRRSLIPRIHAMISAPTGVKIMKRKLLPGYSAADELHKWRRLRDDDTISEDEFQAARAEILGTGEVRQPHNPSRP